MQLGASDLSLHPCLALPWAPLQGGRASSLAPLAAAGYLAMPRRPEVHSLMVSVNFLSTQRE